MKTQQHKIQAEKEKFGQYLKESDIRFTNGREIVFNEVMKAHGHFAAEELVKQCKRHQQKISRATVYRSLNELLEAGIIRKTAFGEKHQHFEHMYDEQPHHHARCIQCGTYIELPDMDEENVYQPQLEKKGFKVLGHELHFYGICKECR